MIPGERAQPVVVVRATKDGGWHVEHPEALAVIFDKHFVEVWVWQKLQTTAIRWEREPKE